MILTYRTLTSWPGERTDPDEMKDGQFTAPWDRTVQILGDEIDRLVSGNRVHTPVTLHVATKDLRRDGFGVTQGARFDHHGVVITFDDAQGRELKFTSDQYRRLWGRREAWRDNVHAIALTLEALRSINRWGVVSDGQQYQGFRAALGSGIAVGPQDESMTPEEAAAYLSEATEGLHPAAAILAERAVAEETYRAAAHLHHPDSRRGNPAVFAKCGTAIAVIRKDQGR